MPSLRERLWGKTKPLRDKLAQASELAVNTAKEIPGEMAKQVGQPILRGFGAVGAKIAYGDINAQFTPQGQFQKDLYGTDNPIDFGSVAEETLGGFKPKSDAGKMGMSFLGGALSVADAVPGGSQVKRGIKTFDGFVDVTTKTLDKLVGRGKVSKQYISDLLNAPDVRQAEKDVMRAALDESGDVVDVASYANKVKTNLLPLKFADTSNMPSAGFLYENITLPDNLRGPVAKYNERIYESPIAVGAGGVHFSREGVPNYFAHTRIEDLPGEYGGEAFGYKGLPTNASEARGEGGTTRRVIEVQSDLMQKGRLDAEVKNSQSFLDLSKERNGLRPDGTPISPEVIKKAEARIAENEKLAPYRNTWHERIIREEFKKAAQDGKKKLQFPVGKTAMQIEGLGNETLWAHADNPEMRVMPDQIKPGMNIVENRPGNELGLKWIVTDVLDNGKFKAIQKGQLEWERKNGMFINQNISDDKILKEFREMDILDKRTETFDISGKVDETNPIYKFYEKDIGKFLQSKFGAKRITDAQGVDWWEADVAGDTADKAVPAFGKAQVGAVLGVAGAGAAITASGMPGEPITYNSSQTKRPKVVQIQTTEEWELEQLQEAVPPEVRKSIINSAKANGIEPKQLAAQLLSEGLTSTSSQLADSEKSEGAIGVGQHRKIFIDEWGDDFKKQYGKEYNPRNTQDNIDMTAFVMSKLIEKLGSWEEALIAYNKGETVVKEYKNDKSLTFDDDPYVKAVKEKLSTSRVESGN